MYVAVIFAEIAVKKSRCFFFLWVSCLFRISLLIFFSLPFYDGCYNNNSFGYTSIVVALLIFKQFS